MIYLEAAGMDLLASPRLSAEARAVLEAHVKPIVVTNATNRLVSLSDLRTPRHFRDHEIVKLNGFFTNLVTVDPPPQEFIDAGTKIKDAGARSYEPFYFPGLSPDQVGDSPLGQGIDPWLYEQVKRSFVSPSAIALEPGWAWIDASIRPSCKEHENLAGPLGDVLADLRTPKIDRPGHPSEGPDKRTRFYVSFQAAKEFVFPALAEKFGVDPTSVTSLSPAEFTLARIVRHQHFGGGDTSEWFRNPYGNAGHLIGGDPDQNGIPKIGYNYSGPPYRFAYVALRPIVRFPSSSE